jgi:hypothetical protein
LAALSSAVVAAPEGQRDQSPVLRTKLSSEARKARPKLARLSKMQKNVSVTERPNLAVASAQVTEDRIPPGREVICENNDIV